MKAESRQIPQSLAARLKFVCRDSMSFTFNWTLSTIREIVAICTKRAFHKNYKLQLKI